MNLSVLIQKQSFLHTFTLNVVTKIHTDFLKVHYLRKWKKFLFFTSDNLELFIIICFVKNFIAL